MTTKANKYGLRAAAAERSKKHSQRTPLPPRPGVVEAAREPIANAPGVAVAASYSDDRSGAKAEAFAERARQQGWNVGIEAVGGATELTATRGAETMIQAWANGVWSYDASFYGYGDRTTKPRNASGAAKLLERTPEDAATEASKVASNKHFRKAEPKDITVRLEEAQRTLPFDPELATNEEITGILAGRALKWYNRISRGTESAMVGRKGARITMLDDGQRVVTFCCPATGYRSCLVTAILKVGVGRTAKDAERETVEVS